ncbi:Cryptochrome DASH [Rubripirellula amarantea]|uniref:Cryptochrome DASH n=1 Tax=Rubripirellula amarantea TaxID=2527999 RepID=A0A5C5WTW5_9BACT|nr:DASH family cryptochrome [Rubripirellula amarantea]TWT53292.1 Cryptochrome DASH [Rubripirellula amarantea]
MTTSLVWFRNDLRLHDHRALSRAVQQSDQVACVFVVAPSAFERTSFGYERVGPFRLQFLRESLIDLRDNLHKIGGVLHVVVGEPEIVLPRIAADIEASTVYCHQEYATEETTTQTRLESSLCESGCSLEVSSANTLLEADDLPFPIDELPELFTHFRNKIEHRTEVLSPLAAPTRVPRLDEKTSAKIPDQPIDSIDLLCRNPSRDDDQATYVDRAVLKFVGGESAGLARVDDYLWKSDCLRTYKETRNGMIGANYSSKFSAWLAMGCLSPRKIYEEVLRYEKERIRNESTYWMYFELLWRDYFAFVVAKHGQHVFQVGGLRQESLDWNQDTAWFDAWRKGKTGYPLIDANMRELEETGFMSNRGRQNVASFLTKNLGIDWRMGAEWFESLLIDYDPCSNYGNWNYVSGVGNDARSFRWFNPIKQASDYDPEGSYVKHWIPELASVPSDKVHTPWKLSQEEQHRYGVVIGDHYPAPLVDLFQSADVQKQRFMKARSHR